MKLTDQHIIEACREGNRKAQEQLYNKYKGLLFGICLRYAKDRVEAEDFLQEGLIVIFRDLLKYKPTAAFGAWLRRVMINVCLQQLRKKKNIFKTSSLENICWNVSSNQYDIFSQFREKALLEMIQKLPVGYRMVFNLYVIEGYSHAEVAKMLGITVNTSKSQLSRAKAVLRKLLKSELVDH